MVCIKVFISSFLNKSSNLAFSVFKTLPLSGRIACVFLSLPCFAEPPAESPSTMNSSLSNLFLLCAGVNLPLNNFSVFLLSFPFLDSSLAFLAASLASFPFNAFETIFVAIVLFSSRK